MVMKGLAGFGVTPAVDDLVRVIHRPQAAPCEILPSRGVELEWLLQSGELGEYIERDRLRCLLRPRKPGLAA